MVWKWCHFKGAVRLRGGIKDTRMAGLLPSYIGKTELLFGALGKGFGTMRLERVGRLDFSKRFLGAHHLKNFLLNLQIDNYLQVIYTTAVMKSTL